MSAYLWCLEMYHLLRNYSRCTRGEQTTKKMAFDRGLAPSSSPDDTATPRRPTTSSARSSVTNGGSSGSVGAYLDILAGWSGGGRVAREEERRQNERGKWTKIKRKKRRKIYIIIRLHFKALSSFNSMFEAKVRRRWGLSNSWTLMEMHDGTVRSSNWGGMLECTQTLCLTPGQDIHFQYASCF